MPPLRSLSTPLFAANFIAAVGCVFAATLRAEEPAQPTGGAAAASPERIEFFEKFVRPVLIEHCYGCHSADAKELQGSLRLDTKAGMLAGGTTGAALKPGDPAGSLFLKLVRHEVAGLEMPPEDKLPAETIARLEQWVREGAFDPRDGAAAIRPDANVLARAEGHWAFAPPRLAPLPEVRHPEWPRADFDRYVLARLEAHGLAPSGDADRATLIRRLSYDLLGLPPTRAEVAEFVADESEGAYERLVERLLAAPQFGERWARHWLDLSRFGDTKGYVFQEDRNYPDAYRYRDFVIQALNDDLPYDQFLTLQLAADQSPPNNQDSHTLAAMGFLTLGRRFINNRHEIIDDRIDVLTRTTLGLTVTCARCHDHKYDPISQKDYYALYAVFASTDEPKNAPSPLRLVDGRPRNARVFIRGNPANQGDEVPRRFLTVLAGGDPQPFQHGSGRVELARAIADPANPLTGRVWANRVWSHLFGVGLVRTPSDFGLRSDPPVQPDVLDWLAVTFVDDGWSTKNLIRRIVLSSTYRQSSAPRPDAEQVDPDNNLLARQNRRRLDFEALRDSLLLAAGDVDPTIGGPSVTITSHPTPRRRTLYAHIDRQNLPGLFRTFDFASPDTHAPQRYETTVPQQALYLLNSPFALEQAERVAARTAAAAGPTAERIRALYHTILQREPDADELALGERFVAGAAPPPAARPPVWLYGYGGYDADRERTAAFQPLPHFTGSAYQGGPQLPDGALGWAMLNAGGGHPGNRPEHAAIRRWVAPAAGKLSVRGELRHPSDQGDGVRGRIVSSRSGLAGQWEVKANAATTNVRELTIEPGDTIDFIVDLRGTIDHDSFQWRCEVRLDTTDGRQRYHTADDFATPTSQAALDAWARYAQALLASNEFAFID